jgi:hypothetical protein
LSVDLDGNEDDFSLILGLEVYKVAALIEVHGVDGEDII